MNQTGSTWRDKDKSRNKGSLVRNRDLKAAQKLDRSLNMFMSLLQAMDRNGSMYAYYALHKQKGKREKNLPLPRPSPLNHAFGPKELRRSLGTWWPVPRIVPWIHSPVVNGVLTPTTVRRQWGLDPVATKREWHNWELKIHKKRRSVGHCIVRQIVVPGTEFLGGRWQRVHKGVCTDMSGVWSLFHYLWMPSVSP